MAGILGYGSDSDSDSDVGLGAIGSMQPAAAGVEVKAISAPMPPASKPAATLQGGIQGPSLPPQVELSRDAPVTPIASAPAVDPVLQARIEAFAQLTMQGNDLAASLVKRIPAVQPPHNPATVTYESYLTAIPSAGVAAALAGPNFFMLEEAAAREQGELERLRAAYPHLQADLAVPGIG